MSKIMFYNLCFTHALQTISLILLRYTSLRLCNCWGEKKSMLRFWMTERKRKSTMRMKQEHIKPLFLLLLQFPGMGILRIFPHLRIFLGSQCMTLNGHISIKRWLHAILASVWSEIHRVTTQVAVFFSKSVPIPEFLTFPR